MVKRFQILLLDLMVSRFLWIFMRLPGQCASRDPCLPSRHLPLISGTPPPNSPQVHARIGFQHARPPPLIFPKLPPPFVSLKGHLFELISSKKKEVLTDFSPEGFFDRFLRNAFPARLSLFPSPAFLREFVFWHGRTTLEFNRSGVSFIFPILTVFRL